MQLLTLTDKAKVAEFTLRVIRAKEVMGLGSWPQAATINELQLKILAATAANGFDYLDTPNRRVVADELGISIGYLSKMLNLMKQNKVITGNFTIPKSLVTLMERKEWVIQFKLVIADGTDGG